MVGKFKKGITVITPTGDRKVMIKKCCDYINRSTLQPDQWVIGDNGEYGTANKVRNLLNPNIQLNIIRDQDLAFKETAFSFTGNLLNIIPEIDYNKIIIMEDDDWYDPTYIEVTSSRLDNFTIVGEIRAIYYNVFHQKYRINNNTNRASLCQTAFTSELLPKFQKYAAMRHSAFVDSRLWEHCRENHVPLGLFEDIRLSIGMKGLPGRKGVGMGHRPGGTYKDDKNWKQLIKLVGREDAQFYIQQHKAMKG